MPLRAYAAYSKDTEERLSSSSGGIFSLLARNILANHGTVYGVAMTDDCKSAIFVRVDERSRLDSLRGSKYFQAKVGNAFKLVKWDIEAGLDVLFTGTACQINGLKGFLGADFSNLFCVDVMCHGTPSPGLWSKYVEYIEKEQGGNLKSIGFRCKDDTWTNFGMEEITDEKRVFIPFTEDPFMTMFLRNLCLRPSCYNCITKAGKKSDLTIADFWGINDVAPEMNDEKGTSLVIIRSEKGGELYSRIHEYIIQKEVSYEDGVKSNPADHRSAKKPLQRDTFFEDMHTMSFEELKEKYCKLTPAPILTKAKGLIKKCIKAVLHKNSRGGVDSAITWNNYGLLFTLKEK